MLKTCKKLLALCAVPVLATAACAVHAAEYPHKAVRIVVPYPPGGTLDIVARSIQEPLSRTLGQPVLIDNKPGASGEIGTRDVAQSAPDGYTLLFGHNAANAIAAAKTVDLGYDPATSFAAISLVAVSPLLLAVNGELPAQDLPSFLALARDRQRSLDYASSGNGGLSHLATELFAQSAGLSLNHVPYKGQAPATTAAASGEVQMVLTSPSAALNAFVAEKRLRLLGVSSAQPSPLAPDIPPLSASLPGFTAEAWFGLLAPARTDAAIVARLNRALGEVLADPATSQRLEGYGLSPAHSTPQAFQQRIATEIATWQRVTREAGIRLE